MRKRVSFLFLALLISFPAQLKLANANFNLSNYPNFSEINNSHKLYRIENPSIIKIDQKEIDCLALNIYFEAGIESKAGKKAVAHVTLNRVRSHKFPNTICEVVKQSRTDIKGNPIRHRCQFSWYCDGKPDNPYKGRNWKESQVIARDYVIRYYQNGKVSNDLTKGSLYYHAVYVRPYWVKYMVKTTRIGRHIFYKFKT